MRTNVVGSSTDERFWFGAQLVAYREPYRQIRFVPAAINPWALRARVLARRARVDWGDWTPRKTGVFVDFFERTRTVTDTGERYEQHREYVICAVGDSVETAKSRVETTLDHSPYLDYDLARIDGDIGESLASQSPVATALHQQTAVHPLIGNTYSPHLPEIHLPVSDRSEIRGLVRIGVTTAQLREQLSRLHRYRQQTYDLGEFKFELQFDAPAHERLRALLQAIEENDTGVIVGGISLTTEPAERTVGLLIDRARLRRMQSTIEQRSQADADEPIRWKFPIDPGSLEQFSTEIEDVLATDAPELLSSDPFERGQRPAPATIAN